MSGPNKHYLPRFFQGYFFNRSNLRGEKITSYKRIDYGELYISIHKQRELVNEEETPRLPCLNKKYKEILLISPPGGEKNNNNFRYTGSYNEFFSNEVDSLISNSEKEELEILKNIEKCSISREREKLLTLDNKKQIYNMIKNFYFRNKIIKNIIDYTVWNMIDNYGLIEEEHREVIENLMIENISSKGEENGFSWSKYYANSIIKKVINSNFHEKFEYKYFKFIKIEEENLILTENVVFTLDKKNDIKIIYPYDFEKIETFIFLLNKEEAFIISKKVININKLSGKITNTLLYENSCEFILSEKMININNNDKYMTIRKDFEDIIKDACKDLLNEYEGYKNIGYSKENSIKEIINNLKKIM